MHAKRALKIALFNEKETYCSLLHTPQVCEPEGSFCSQKSPVSCKRSPVNSVEEFRKEPCKLCRRASLGLTMLKTKRVIDTSIPRPFAREKSLTTHKKQKDLSTQAHLRPFAVSNAWPPLSGCFLGSQTAVKSGMKVFFLDFFWFFCGRRFRGKAERLWPAVAPWTQSLPKVFGVLSG